MEASALPHPAGLPRTRLSVATPLLRLRSDEQLVALFRGGSEDAFRTIHDRYRSRLLAYARQMLGGAQADAEDALQDVFVRAYGSLRANARPISLRAWLYRIAHNRCIDELRRPRPVPSEIHPADELALSRGARHDPPVEAQRGEELRRLIADVRALPEQQRSALLMRELQGLTYEELATALEISVPAVKSLLLRARTSLVDATLARETPCEEIHLALLDAHGRGVRASGRARRHMRECSSCAQYRGQLQRVHREIAALVPSGPLGHLGVLFGLGGSGAGAGGSLAAGGGAATAAVGGTAATKVAAIVCCAALIGTAGGALHHGDGAPAHRAAHPARNAAEARSALPTGSSRAPAASVGHAARDAGAAAHLPASRHRNADPAQPLTGQDAVYDTPAAAGGVNSALTQTGGTAAEVPTETPAQPPVADRLPGGAGTGSAGGATSGAPQQPSSTAGRPVDGASRPATAPASTIPAPQSSSQP